MDEVKRAHTAGLVFGLLSGPVDLGKQADIIWMDSRALEFTRRKLFSAARGSGCGTIFDPVRFSEDESICSKWKLLDRPKNLTILSGPSSLSAYLSCPDLVLFSQEAALI